MEFKILRKWLSPVLYPASLLYGLVTGIRNYLFNKGYFKIESFRFPVISVGNITAGGTGKTPHVEYLMSLLSEKYSVAILSRGYKRRTSGFVLAGDNSTPKEIGDEPYQMFLRKKASVAVCEDRAKGISILINKIKNLQCIILDDAYQHRKVKPGLSVLLVDYNRPIYNDKLLPYGDLRENVKGLKRADIVVVSKIPLEVETIDKFEWIKKLGVSADQLIYFTKFSYGMLTPVFESNTEHPSLEEIKKSKCSILLLTGIANPENLYNELLKWGCSINHLRYPDHHDYSRYDMDVINTKFRLMPKKRIIITTEKDAVKMRQLTRIDDETKRQSYYLPVTVEFMLGKTEEFNQVIFNYVEKNKRGR